MRWCRIGGIVTRSLPRARDPEDRVNEKAVDEQQDNLDGNENPASVTVTDFQTPIGTLSTSAEPYLIGNLAGGDRVFDGRIAEFAIWEETILSAGNVSTLWNSGAGLRADSPTLGIMPTFYMTLCGRNSPEQNEIPGASTGVVTGTLKQVHPVANCPSNLMMMGIG